MILTAMVSEICGGQTNVPILVTSIDDVAYAFVVCVCKNQQ